MTLTDEQRALFNGRNFVTVSTLGKDGAPRATTIWADLDDQGRIVVNSRLTRGWPKNLKRESRVALNIFDIDDPYKNLAITAHVDGMTTEGAIDQIHALSRLYTGHDFGGVLEDRVTIRFAIDSVFAYGFD